MSALTPAGPILARMSALLEGAGIPFMVAGSFASGHHGVPRMTRDLDLVVDPTREQLVALLDAVPADALYVDRRAALDALADRSMFNVIDLAGGWKVDLIVRKARAFSREELGRRQSAVIEGVQLPVATAEDTIVAKLEWARRGRSERQLDDVRGILDLQGQALDRAYVERWVAELGLGAQWRAAQADPELPLA